MRTINDLFVSVVMWISTAAMVVVLVLSVVGYIYNYSTKDKAAIEWTKGAAQVLGYDISGMSNDDIVSIHNEIWVHKAEIEHELHIRKVMQEYGIVTTN